MAIKTKEKQEVISITRSDSTLNLFYRALLTFFVTILVVPSTISLVMAAGTATISWDKSQEPDIKGYKIFYGTESGNLTDYMEVDSPDKTSYTFDDLQEGKTYYFYVVAVDFGGQESEPSDEVSKSIPVSNLPPNAVISASETSGFAPFKVAFDASKSSDPNQGDTLTYSWNFGDGSTGKGVSLDHTYQNAGSYDVHLTVTDSAGATGQAQVTITVSSNKPPVARFKASKTAGFMPLEIVFDAKDSSDPDGTITRYAWDFGDGTTQEGEKVTHTFTSEGVYTVTLTVFDDKEGQNSTSLDIHVKKGYIYTWIVGRRDDTQLHAISDTYINANSVNYSSEKLLRTYVWPANEPANSVLIKADLSSIPKDSEIKSATLQLYMAEIEGNGGDQSLKISINKIVNVNPVIDACTGMTYDGKNPWSQNGVRNDGVPLAQGDISDAEDIKTVGLSHQTVTWNVTNMVQAWVKEPGKNYGLLLNPVTDASSGSNRYFASSEYDDKTRRPILKITFVSPKPLNLPPVAKITASTTTGRAPLVVDLSAAASKDPDGSIKAFDWSVNGTNIGNGKEISHEFKEPGEYLVHLVVTDDSGLSASDTLKIVVVDNKKPLARIKADKTSGKAPLTVKLDGSGSEDPDGQIVSWTWDFGDGTTGNGKTVSHEFSAGSYKVRLTVTDDSGDEASSWINVDVKGDSLPEILNFKADKNELDDPPWNITFTAEVTDPEDGTPSITIDFGDGFTGTKLPAVHTYSEAGDYQVTLTAKDSSGNEVNKSLNVKLSDSSPKVPNGLKVTLNN